MELLKKFILWFVAGAGLVAGGMCAVWLFTLLDEPGDQKHIDHPAQIRVSVVEPVQFTKFLTVTGTLTNTGKSTYSSSFLELALVKDNRILFTCGDVDSTKIPPGATASFQIVCEAIERVSVPSDVGYRVSVLRATIE